MNIHASNGVENIDVNQAQGKPSADFVLQFRFCYSYYCRTLCLQLSLSFGCYH